MSDQEEYQRKQAQIGLASNVLGITAGTAALGAAARDPRLKDKNAGKVAQALGRAGDKIPAPVQSRLDAMMKDPKKRARAGKIGGALAVGATGLQAANLGGDLVANRVLARESKVKKNAAKNVYQSAGTVGSRLTPEKRKALKELYRAKTKPTAREQVAALQHIPSSFVKKPASLDYDKFGKRVTTPFQVGRLAHHAPPTGLTADQVQMQRWQRKAAAGRTKMNHTTPSERVASARSSDRSLRSRAKAVDEARAAREAKGSTGIGRMEAAAPAPAAQPTSRFTTKQKRTSAIGAGLLGGGGVVGYNFNKSMTPEQKRRAQQNAAVALGAGGAVGGSLSAANQLTLINMETKHKGGSGGGTKTRHHGKALAWKDAVDRLAYKGKGPKPKIGSRAKAAMYAGGALASGAVGTAAAKRSTSDKARRWN